MPHLPHTTPSHEGSHVAPIHTAHTRRKLARKPEPHQLAPLPESPPVYVAPPVAPGYGASPSADPGVGY